MGEKYEKRAAYGLNQVILAPCFIAKAGELKYTKSGKPRCTFTIGFDASYKGSDGVVESKYYFPCVLWGKQAEALSDFITTGRQVDVAGKLTQRLWENKEGKKNSIIELVVGTINFRPSAKKASDEKEEKESKEAPSEDDSANGGDDFGDDFDNDEVPF